MKNHIVLSFLFFMLILFTKSQAQIFHEDFENPDSVTYSSFGSSNWAQNSRLYTSANFCDSATIQNPGDVAIMTTVPFSTLGIDSVFLYFNHICKVEFFDGGSIEVSNDSGITWIPISCDQASGNTNCIYYGASLYNSQGSKFQEASYSTWYPGIISTPEFYWWKREIFDLSQLLANSPNAMIRFVLADYNNNGSNGRAGWFIDDVEVHDTLDTYLYTFQNRIRGKMFVDLNSNLVHDAGEPPVASKQIRQLSSPYADFTDSSGLYEIITYSIGSVSVKPDPTIVTHPYFNLVPNSNNANFTALGQVDSLNDFALQPSIIANDLSIQILQMFNCKNNSPTADYWFDAYNKGSSVLNPVLVFYPISLLTYDSSSVIPSHVSIDSIVLPIGPLFPFQHRSINVRMIKPLGLPLGTVILSSIKIEPISGDANDQDNVDYDLTFISSSYDPNMIQVDTTSLTLPDIAAAKYLEYTIYFQNTGNDTALYVRVDNSIPATLDLSTFELLANSHDIKLDYNYLADPRLISFTFNNINLPDSNTNESESHGFIRYHIQPLSSLAAGDSILNNAQIYFDLNAPVATNTAITEIVDPTSIDEMTMQNNWSVFPNPVNSELKINYELILEENITLEIFNLYGQKVEILKNEKTGAGKHQHKFNVESLSNGVYLIQLTVGDHKQVKKFVKVE